MPLQITIVRASLTDFVTVAVPCDRYDPTIERDIPRIVDELAGMVRHGKQKWSGADMAEGISTCWEVPGGMLKPGGGKRLAKRIAKEIGSIHGVECTIVDDTDKIRAMNKAKAAKVPK